MPLDICRRSCSTSDAPKIKVNYSESITEKLTDELREAITEILAEDPRPGYQDDPDRVYTFKFDRYEISFKASEEAITVTDIQ